MDARDLLDQELKKCISPVTGKNVACLIKTAQGIYFGHNVETEKPLVFTHAEEMAFSNLLRNEQSPKIEELSLRGSGFATALKNIIPCFRCFTRLSPYIDANTRITITNPSGNGEDLLLRVADFEKAYAAYPETAMQETTRPSIVQEIERRTLLRGLDAELVAEVRLLGLRAGITFILLGSSAGKGGASSIVIEKTGCSYHDIDLLALTDKNPLLVERIVMAIAQNTYTNCELERKECPVPEKKSTRTKRKYTCHVSSRTYRIELDIGNRLVDILHMPEYIHLNWFHYLSKGDWKIEKEI